MSATTRKKFDHGKAFRLARVLLKHVDASGDPIAARSMRRVVTALSVPVAHIAVSAAGLSPATMALAVRIEFPELSNAEIARRVGCSVKTLERDPRYRRMSEMLQLGREKFRAPSKQRDDALDSDDE